MCRWCGCAGYHSEFCRGFAVHDPARRKPLVYVAGPYTFPDPCVNTNAMIKVGTRLIEDGVVTPLVPLLTMLWHLVDPHPVEFWYAYDLELLARCDVLLRLPGQSTGADIEVAEAQRLGTPVVFNVEELYDLALASAPGDQS